MHACTITMCVCVFFPHSSAANVVDVLCYACRPLQPPLWPPLEWWQKDMGVLLNYHVACRVLKCRTRTPRSSEARLLLCNYIAARLRVCGMMMMVCWNVPNIIDYVCSTGTRAHCEPEWAKRVHNGNAHKRIVQNIWYAMSCAVWRNAYRVRGSIRSICGVVSAVDDKALSDRVAHRTSNVVLCLRVDVYTWDTIRIPMCIDEYIA